jgi:hypothetical protein
MAQPSERNRTVGEALMDIGVIMIITGLAGLVVTTSILAFTNVRFLTLVGIEEYGTLGLALVYVRQAMGLSSLCGLFLLLIGYRRSEREKRENLKSSEQGRASEEETTRRQ